MLGQAELVQLLIDVVELPTQRAAFGRVDNARRQRKAPHTPAVDASGRRFGRLDDSVLILLIEHWHKRVSILLTNRFGNHALLGFVFAFRHRGEPTEQEQSEN